MKKGIITILVIAIIIVLIVLAARNNNKDAAVEIIPQPTENETPSLPNNPPIQTESENTTLNTPTTHTVSYASTGFSPSSITIKAGDTVTFTNGTSSKMWVASDPHPQHTDFSDFDAGKGYEAGTSYSYTFMEAGTFTYHDHLHSSMRGTVTVE
jgi:plastocyanin